MKIHKIKQVSDSFSILKSLKNQLKEEIADPLSGISALDTGNNAFMQGFRTGMSGLIKSKYSEKQAQSDIKNFKIDSVNEDEFNSFLYTHPSFKFWAPGTTYRIKEEVARFLDYFIPRYKNIVAANDNDSKLIQSMQNVDTDKKFLQVLGRIRNPIVEEEYFKFLKGEYGNGDYKNMIKTFLAKYKRTSDKEIDQAVIDFVSGFKERET